MPKETKGHANCPECNDLQAVQFDGRKYFISCTNCRTFTSYQSKEAKARIQQRLTPIAAPEHEPKEDQPEPIQGSPDDEQGRSNAAGAGRAGAAIKTTGKPYKPVKTPSFLESLSEFL